MIIKIDAQAYAHTNTNGCVEKECEMNDKFKIITAHEDIRLNTKRYHKIPFIVSIYYSFTIFIILLCCFFLLALARAVAVVAAVGLKLKFLPKITTKANEQKNKPKINLQQHHVHAQAKKRKKHRTPIQNVLKYCVAFHFISAQFKQKKSKKETKRKEKEKSDDLSDYLSYQ